MMLDLRPKTQVSSPVLSLCELQKVTQLSENQSLGQNENMLAFPLGVANFPIGLLGTLDEIIDHSIYRCRVL